MAVRSADRPSFVLVPAGGDNFQRYDMLMLIGRVDRLIFSVSIHGLSGWSGGMAADSRVFCLVSIFAVIDWKRSLVCMIHLPGVLIE